MSETMYRDLFEGISAIVYSYSKQSGGIYYSPNVHSVLGFSQSQLLQSPQLWHDSIHAEDLPRVDKAIHEFQEGEEFEIEYRIIDSEGNCHWFIDKSIARSTHDGEVVIKGIAIDISDRKKAEIKLAENERNMLTVLNNTHDVIVRIDRDFKHIFANSALYTVTGETPEQYLGKTNDEIGMPEQLCSFWRKKHQEVFATGKPDYFEFSYPTIENGERTFQAAVCPEFNDNKEVETICSFMRDITELKIAESEKDAVIDKLKKSLAKVKTLSGLLPICSHCKKIRDDKGYWTQIESYIYEHSEADFSHSICPECAKKYYPDLNIFDEDDTQG